MKWEYRMDVLDTTIVNARIKASEALTEMNQAGAEGWEMVTMHSDGTNHFTVYKRPRQE